MPRYVLPFIVVLASLLVVNAARGAGPTQVESLGAPDRLVVEGTTPALADGLRSALLQDPELLWIGHPLAPRGEFLHALQIRAELGLKHAGYPDARVEATTDERAANGRSDSRECVVLRVKSGTKFFAKEPKVRGAKPDIATRLRRAICEPTPPADAIPTPIDLPNGRSGIEWRGADGFKVEMRPPLWRVGEAAPFDSPTRDRIRVELLRSLAEIGHDAARLRVDIRKPAQGPMAELTVELIDVGPPSVVREIDLQDGGRNSRATVLAYLDLTEGRKITQIDRLRWEDRLRSSGRFVRHDIKLERRFGGDGVRLRFDLEEYPQAPPLDHPLSREEAALQRCREWLLRMDTHGYDLVASRVPSPAQAKGEPSWLGQITVAPQRGIIISTQTSNGPGPSLGLLSDQIACYLPHGAGRLEIPFNSQAQFQGTVGLTLSPSETRESQPFRLTIAGGVRSNDQPASIPLAGLQFRFDPVFFIALAHEKGAQAQWDGDILTLATGSEKVRIDAKSGRLVEVVLGADSELNLGQWRITTEQGRFDRRLAELRKLPGPNHFQPQRPITSIAKFLGSAKTLDELMSLLPPSSPASPKTSSHFTTIGPLLAGMLRRCADQNAFAGLDAALTDNTPESPSSSQEVITIPPPISTTLESSTPVENPMLPLAGYLVHLGDLMFERNTWPATLLRLAASVIAEQTKYAQYDLMRIYGSQEVGPIGFLATSSVVPMPIFAATFAQKGRERLATDYFRRDCRLLLDPLDRLSATPAIVAALDGMTREEALQIGNSLLGDGPLFVEFVDQLRQTARQASPRDALAKSLEAWWERGLRARMDAELRERSSLDTARKP